MFHHLVSVKKSRLRNYFPALVCLCHLAATAWAMETNPPAPTLTVATIFGQNAFSPAESPAATWLADGSGYTVLEAAPAGGRDVVRYDPASGRREVLVAAAQLQLPGATKPFPIAEYAWSTNTQKLLLFTNTRRVWRRETRGDYWVYDRGSGRLQALGGGGEPATLMFAAFSPDGSRVAYVRHNDLFTQDLATGRITRLTKDGSATCINGTSDWVYEEEFDLRRAFQWSPDSRSLAYWQFDTRGVPEMSLVNQTDSLYPQVTRYPYPKVGQTNSACRLGVVRANGGRTHWLALPGDSRNHYVPHLLWTPDSRQVVCQQLNRLQNTNLVLVADARTGASRTLFTDRDDAWVEAVPEWRWQGAHGQLLWFSERGGWRQLYALNPTNGTPTLLTPGRFDVVDLAGVDETGGWVYFTAGPKDPTQRLLFRVPLAGGGEAQSVTPADRPGTHSYEFSPDGHWAIHTASRLGEPPVTDLIHLPGHETVRVLVDNAALRAKLAALALPAPEFFRLPLTNGPELDAWCLRPPGFDPAKKYPLFIHVYGEPAGSTVKDAWGGGNYLWHQMLARLGYVVVSIDNRGTAAPRGRDWRKSIYRQIGVLASADQAQATEALLRARPYLDRARVGIWGWSGGGSMSLNALFRHPDLYQMAMAVAFVSDQHYYDTIYQERYMGLPDDNAAGYRAGSPITFAHQLTGKLLLVYGTGDDNCHYQNCEALVNELIRQNKLFSLMAYPNRTHAIREGENTRRHLYTTLTDYLQANLPARQ